MHLLALILLALITLPSTPGSQRLTVTLASGDTETAVLEQFDIEPAEMPVAEVAEADAVDSSQASFEFDAADLPSLQDLTLPPVVAEVGTNSAGSSPGGGQSTVDVDMFGGRSGATKQALLAAYGGTERTEHAVELGLRWLVRNQTRNGSWSLQGPYRDEGTIENRVAATAMAILALAGAGNTHQSGEYQTSVKRGLVWLLGQLKNGRFGNDQSYSHHQTYGQAQATIALCELYALTNDSSLYSDCQSAIDYAVEAQSPSGGWRYQPRAGSDTSVTGWYVMAMQSASHSDVTFSPSVWERVKYYLDAASHHEGAAYGYQIGGSYSGTMTAEGLLCRQYLGWDRDREAMKLGVSSLLAEQNFDVDQRNVYYWYYASQVMHHVGGSPWQMWNDRMKVGLPRMQIKRGAESGSWPPQGDEYGRTGGRLYTTCLSILCLEVYYRHLPIYSPPVDP